MGRDVVFNLKVEDDPKNKGIMGSFSRQIAELKKDLDNALSGGRSRGGGGSGGGRTGGGNNGPNDDLKDRIKLAGQLLNTQVKEEAKRLATEKRMRDVADANDRQREMAFTKWRTDLRIKSFQLEARENERLRKESEQNQRRQQVESRREQRVHMMTERRRDAALNRVFRGGVGAIGSIGGFIGGDTGSALGNVALGGHVAKETYEGAKGLAGGIGTLMNPALRGSAAVGAGAPVAAAGATALIAWLPALAMAVQGATIAIKGSSSTAAAVTFKGGRLLDRGAGSGHLGSAFGEGIASSSFNYQRLISRNLSHADLEQQAAQTGQDRFSDNARAQSNLELSNRVYNSQGRWDKEGKRWVATGSLVRQSELDKNRRERLSQLSGSVGISDYDAGDYARGQRPIGPAGVGTASSLGAGSVGASTFLSRRQIRDTELQFGGIRRDAANEQIGLSARAGAIGGKKDDLRSQIRADEAIRGDTSLGDQKSGVRLEAEQRIIEAREKLRSLDRESQSIATDTARLRLGSAKQEYEIRKQMADEAEESHKSDLEKFAEASPEERARIRAVGAAQKSGAKLTRGQALVARGYNQFREFGRSQLQQIGQDASGDLFAGGKQEREMRKRAAEEAKVKADQETIKLDNQLKVNVTLTNDKTFEQVAEPEFAKLFQEIDKRMHDQNEYFRTELEKGINKFGNGRRVPVKPSGS